MRIILILLMIGISSTAYADSDALRRQYYEAATKHRDALAQEWAAEESFWACKDAAKDEVKAVLEYLDGISEAEKQAVFKELEIDDKCLDKKEELRRLMEVTETLQQEEDKALSRWWLEKRQHLYE